MSEIADQVIHEHAAAFLRGLAETADRNDVLAPTMGGFHAGLMLAIEDPDRALAVLHQVESLLADWQTGSTPEQVEVDHRVPLRQARRTREAVIAQLEAVGGQDVR